MIMMLMMTNVTVIAAEAAQKVSCLQRREKYSIMSGTVYTNI